MSDKLVWSNNATLNSLLALSEEDLKAELVDYGYNEEFISDMSLDELHNILHNEETFWEMDIDDFDLNIEPMINRQTCDGIVLMVGEYSRWDGKGPAGKAVFTEDLKGGDIDPSVENIEIIEDGSGLVWLGRHHDGTHRFRLYALPEENQVEFIENCMEDAIEDQFNWYYSDEDIDNVKDDIIEDILAQFTDLYYLNDNINFGQVPNYCKPITLPNYSKPNVLHGVLSDFLDESADVATITVDAVLDDDVDLEDIRAYDIEPEYSWNKTLDNLKLTGTKENIVRYLKSGLYNADDEWIKEFYPELLDEELNEASSKNPKKLAKELKEIKKLANDYGFEYFTAMPFTSYDNDPISIEYNYPEFFRIVKAFWKEMELLDKDSLNNSDVLDTAWETDIDQHDWDTIIRVCEMILERGTPIQFEKIFKNNFDSGLNDDDILASREKAERQVDIPGRDPYAWFDESLNEEKKTYMCDDCGYEVELDDKEYTGKCPNCGEHHGFYELNESVDTKHLVDKFVKYVDESGSNDIKVTKIERETNGYLVELERDGLGGTFKANCKFKDNGDILYLDTTIIDEDDNWDDRVEEAGGLYWALKEANDKDYIKFNDYDSFIDYTTDYEIIVQEFEYYDESLNEESKEDIIARNKAMSEDENKVEELLMSFPSNGEREIDKKLTQWVFYDNSEEDYKQWVDQITKFVNDKRFKIYGGHFEDIDTGEEVYQFILPWESTERKLNRTDHDLTDLTSILNKIEGMPLDEPFSDRYHKINEGKGIITDKVIVKTNEPGFISKKHELESQGYKLNGSGDGQLIYVKFEDDESLN